MLGSLAGLPIELPIEVRVPSQDQPRREDYFWLKANTDSILVKLLRHANLPPARWRGIVIEQEHPARCLLPRVFLESETRAQIMCLLLRVRD